MGRLIRLTCVRRGFESIDCRRAPSSVCREAQNINTKLSSNRRHTHRGTAIGLWVVSALSLAQCVQVQAQSAAPVLSQLETSLTEVVDQASPEIAAVAVIIPSASQPLGSDVDVFELIAGNATSQVIPSRFGSAIVLESDSPNTLLLTSAHLVEGLAPRDGPRVPRIFLRFSNRQSVSAVVHAADPRSGLAVLRVADGEKLLASFDGLRMGAGEGLRRGSLVMVLGNPYALARDGRCSAHLGMVSNFGRVGRLSGQQDSDEWIHALGTLMHLDARLPIGSSGAAVLDLNGRLVGIAESLAPLEGIESGAGFAVPMTPGFRRIVGELVAGYEVEYGFLGVTPATAPAAELEELRPSITQQTAVRVNRVARNSPAERGGLQPGDLILSLNGNPLLTHEELIRETGLLGPGERAELFVWRSREFKNLQAILGKWPVYDDSRIISSAQRFVPWRGVSVDYSTARRRYLQDPFLASSPPGVVVTSVAETSPAASAGLKPGQFIAKVGGHSVETPKDFHQTIENLSGPVTVVLSDQTEVLVPERSPVPSDP